MALRKNFRTADRAIKGNPRRTGVDESVQGAFLGRRTANSAGLAGNIKNLPEIKNQGEHHDQRDTDD